LEHNAIVCESKVKYWSSITPNNVNLMTNGILSLLHFISKLGIAAELVFKVSNFRSYFYLKINAFDLLIFDKKNLLGSSEQRF